MSILGYSSSYFLPQYWADTPLYGEKIIPLLDYMLSMEYENSDNLAQAFYNIENKYKNQQDLPIEVVEEIIEENGYSYVKDLLGNNEESIRLLLSLMVLVHQLKGTKLGIIAVLSLLRRDNNVLVMQTVGNPVVDESTKDISGFTLHDYVIFNGFSAIDDNILLELKFSGFNLRSNQCIFSVNDYGISVKIDTAGHLVLSLGSNRLNWNILNNVVTSRTLTPGTEYSLRLQYDGYEYSLQVSTDGKNYETWLAEESNVSLNIEGGMLYFGVDASEGIIKDPFSGYVNFSNFSISTDNIEIEQWFEQTPVGPENTFIIKTDLDVDLVSSDFFNKFSKFVKNYVYPSLATFTANLKFRSNLTFLPYIRSRVTYVAMGDVNYTAPFWVKTDDDSLEATDPFYVDDGYGGEEEFEIVTDTINFEVSDGGYFMVDDGYGGEEEFLVR